MTPVGWKQFMMVFEEVVVCGGVAFHPPAARPGSTKGIHPCDGSAQCRGCQCTALSPQLLMALKSAHTVNEALLLVSVPNKLPPQLQR